MSNPATPERALMSYPSNEEPSGQERTGSDHKHTPNRWRVAVEKTTVGEFGWTWATKIYRHDRDWGVLSIPTGEMSKVQPPPHPDALLIAAAPALRDALTELVRLLEPLEESGRLDLPGVATLNRYRRVLTLADGREGT